MLNLRAVALAGLLACTWSCQHSEQEQGDAALPAASRVVSADPKLPSEFGKFAEEKVVEIPVEMVVAGVITRPRAPIRTGPGVDLPLTDWILTKGDRVLMFDQVGRWVRILSLEHGHRGWLHEAFIGKADFQQGQKLTLDTALLPSSFAQRRLARVEPFKRGQAIKANIPRGSAFRILRVDGERSLVLVPKTNVAIWVSRKDVQ